MAEAIDPATMHHLTGNDALKPMATRVGGMLRPALAA
jgi:hypothetical protein